MRRSPLYRRRTSLKRVVLSLLVLIVIGLAGAGGVALWGMKAVRAPGPLAEPANVVIEHGQATREIGAVLERQGVVADQRLFVLTTYLTRAARGDLKAGEYEFPAHASIADVLAILRSGRAVVHKITIPEGWTSAQVMERVNAHPALTGTLTDTPPEGSLLPDTYVFQRGATREAIVTRMRQARDTVLDSLWEQRAPDLPIKSKEEAVILASIVEKETGVAAERQQVAAVFINRLRRNMRLQSDPTIIYGITGGARPLDRPITRSDIAAETPYNTYRIERLPPTPIANPGRDSIAAVLQPGTTDDLYFVADGSGGHSFSRTLNEHNANVRRWRQIEQTAGQQSQGDDGAEVIVSTEEPAAEASEPADTESTSTAPSRLDPEESPSGDKAEELLAAAGAGEESVAAVEPSDMPADEPPAQSAAPQSAAPPSAAPPSATPQSATPPSAASQSGTEAETEAGAALAEQSVPIPMPKPRRN